MRSFAADGVESELSLVHPNDVDWFITLDETHHELTARGNKGGSTIGAALENFERIFFIEIHFQ